MQIIFLLPVKIQLLYPSHSPLAGGQASRGYGERRMLDMEPQGAESRGCCYIAVSPEMAADMQSSRGDDELLRKRESKQWEKKTEGQERQAAAAF